MAGPYGSRPPQQSTTSILPHGIVYLLAVLPFTLALFAFSLQWRGDTTARASIVNRLSGDDSKLPGASDYSPSSAHSVTSSDCEDLLHRATLMPSFSYRAMGWRYQPLRGLHPKICITTSTSAGLDQILPWLFYHKVIGVSNFFLFVEGKAASVNVSSVLASINGVKLVFRTKELEEEQAKSRIWNETWLSSFFFRPCNYELFVKQSLNMEMAIVMARDAGMDWIVHLDTDELLHPAGAQEYSLTRLLMDVEKDVDMVIFPNYESAIERDNIVDPFSEVSMFKKNYDHVTKETYFGLYKEATRGNPNYFLTYGNGKSAARIQDHLRPNGAHRWHNYMKTPKEIKLEEAAVLHYTYTRFSDLTSRRDRCGCKPTKEDVKRCFMLEFDRAAFIIASTATESEMRNWYKEKVVWTDKELNLKLMRKGLLTRIYAPMIMVRGLREAGVFSDVLKGNITKLELEPIRQKTSTSESPMIVEKSSHASNWDIANSNSGSDSVTIRKLLMLPHSSEMAMPPLPSPVFDS